MNALATLLATAAVTAGSIKAIRALRKRMRNAPERARTMRKGTARMRDKDVIDLERNAHTGVYGIAEQD
ncbi:hypothetical protein [Parvularcula lutaonensis]|uniref:Uncharacterized protein n=2 Tax=Parvularcula lutaonensis TaxID=491923 RepID=A0ABV7MAB9_9PROT